MREELDSEHMKGFGHQGFSAIEMIVSLGIVACALAALSSFSTSAFGLFSNMERTQAVAASFEDVRLALKSSAQCTLNLQNTPLSMSQPEGAQVAQISSYNKSNQLQNIILKVGQTEKGLTLQDVRLLPAVQVDASLMVANLQMIFQKGTGNGAQTLNRVIPIYARIQSGKVKECWEKFDQGVVEANEVCLTLSGGALNTADPNAASCGLANGKWFAGNSQSATCPNGTVLPKTANADSNCKFDVGAAFVDTFGGALVNLTDGSTAPFSRPPIVTQLDSATATCQCITATDLTAAQAGQIQCSILCLVP